MDSAWSSESYQELSKLIKKSKPDVVHFHSIFPQISPSAYAACFDNGVPVVHTFFIKPSLNISTSRKLSQRNKPTHLLVVSCPTITGNLPGICTGCQQRITITFMHQ
jgi:hypothetical protein